MPFSESDGTSFKKIEKTDLILRRLGYCRLKLNEKYLKRMVTHCKKVGFI